MIFMILFLYKNAAAYYLTIDPKKGRRVMKLEVSTDSVPGAGVSLSWKTQQHISSGEGRRGRPERWSRYSNGNRVRRRMKGGRKHTRKKRDLQKEISMKSTDTTLQPQNFMNLTAASGRSAGHVPVYTDETQAIIFSWTKAGDNNTCSLLQLYST